MLRTSLQDAVHLDEIYVVSARARARAEITVGSLEEEGRRDSPGCDFGFARSQKRHFGVFYFGYFRPSNRALLSSFS